MDAVGDALDLTNGSSAVSIGPGDPSLIEEEEGETGTETTTSGGQVEVDGVQYTITGGFSDALIPAGFVKGEKQFEGANCEVVTQEASGRSAFYLTLWTAEKRISSYMMTTMAHFPRLNP